MYAEAGHVRLKPGARGWIVDYARPQWSGLLVGQPLSEAELRVGRVHGLCGMAHRIALTRAAEGGAPIAPERAAARELLLRVEQVEAMARRAALEFTTALRLPPAPGMAAPVLKAAGRARAALGLSSALGPLAPAATLGSAFADLREAFAQAVECCPKLPRDRLRVFRPSLVMLVTQAWAAPAKLLGELTTAIAELVPAVGAAAAEPELVEGRGRGIAATHRGLLTYDVTVVSGRVERAGSTTPTDLRFGGEGTARHILADLDRQVVAEGSLTIAMCALDPCVPWSVEEHVDA